MRQGLSMRGGTLAVWPLQLGSVVLPVLLMVVAGLWLWRAEYRIAEETVRRNAVLVAEYSLRVLSAQDQLLRYADAFATPGRVQFDPQAIGDHFAELIEADAFSLGLALVLADGTYHVSSFATAPSFNVAERAYFKALREGRVIPYVDRINILPTGEDAIVVARRRAGDAFDGVLVTAIATAALSEFFATLAAAEGASASLIRADGMLLLRHDPYQPPLMIEPPAPILEVIDGRRVDTYEVAAQSDGLTRLYTTVPIQGFDLFASFGLPVSNIWTAWRRGMAMVVAALSAMSLLALLAVAEMRRRLQQRLDAQLVAKSQMAADYQMVLFQELNHRVKNNLQLVNSLLRLRGRGKSQELRAILDDLGQRVGAIGLVHEEFAGASGAETINLDRLLGRISRNPGMVPPERAIVVHCRVQPIVLPVERAIPVALIVVEAVTNAVKHAFPDGRPGIIEVGLRADAAEMALSVNDNGVGFTVDPAAGESAGLSLIEALAQQLGGAMHIEAVGGTRLTVTFPIAGAASAA
jgi:two-component sensor histidine kinase